MSSHADRIAQNLAEVRERIGAAARRAGRSPAAVMLVAVTKYVGVAEARALVAAGCRDLGESRPQELWRKADEMADAGARWHLIGHLQRNKVERTLPLVALVHSCDSWRLAEAISTAASKQQLAPAQVLLEVNISGEAPKHGFAPTDLEPLLPRFAALPGLQVRGLMAMAGEAGDLGAARRQFAALRELREGLIPRCPPGVELAELSMGMSGDYEAAIEEGATIVRVGSALFEGIA